MEGLCECGCGQHTRLAYRNDKERGWIKGEPIRYVNGHYWRGRTDFPESAKRKIARKYRQRVRSPQDHPAWKGGTKLCLGYVYLHYPNHPHANKYGYVKRAVVVACKQLGRTLLPGECVHHKDGNRQNDSVDNIVVMTRAEHSLLHIRARRSKDAC